MSGRLPHCWPEIGKMKSTFVRIIATVIVLCAAVVPSHADEQAPAAATKPPRIRVMTYNIQHGAGMDKQIDLARTAKVITDARPDLVALQEVDSKTKRSNGVDEAAELGKLT